MAAPSEKLADSVEILHKLQESGGVIAIRSADLSRTHRERLVKNGFLEEVLKGWYIPSRPDETKGESTAWYASFWQFCAAYLNHLKADDWCLSPEQSIALHAENWAVPQQLLVRAVKARNYEFLVYRLLRERLEAGNLFCPDSARYRSFEDDLVDDATFEQRSVLLPQMGIVGASMPVKKQIEALKAQLNDRFDAVNQRIRNGGNAFVQLQRGRTVWERGRHTQEPLRYEPFFDSAQRVDIDQLLLFVDKKTDFMSAFEHVLGPYQRARASKPVTIAALMATRPISDWGACRRYPISHGSNSRPRPRTSSDWKH